MKKLITGISLAIACLLLTACGETPINFIFQKFDKTVYEEFMEISSVQNNFISNANDVALISGLVTEEKNYLDKSFELFQNTNDYILLIMPIFDLGQNSPGSSAVYSTNNFTNEKFKQISMFQVEHLKQSLFTENTENYYYRMDWTEGGIVINYTLNINYDNNLNQTEYKINVDYQDSNVDGVSFNKFYLVKYDTETGYFYFEIKEHENAIGGTVVEYYVLESGFYISRITECTYNQMSVPNYVGVDFMIQNFNGRVKYSNYGTVRPDNIKNLNNVTYSNFAVISSDDKSTTFKYAYDISDGRISVDKVVK